MEENDFASQSFLQWFVDEQVEEEASVDNVVQQLKMIKDNPVEITTPHLRKIIKANKNIVSIDIPIGIAGIAATTKDVS